ncbi:helix-turn-helix domain-containing protein [Pasteurellaceae bacterium TAE3-ERU1]|nr:helix-turn-helix domain-containing protein [Pasteurellaceae bacterium TAE3-ERU1]
MARSTLQYWIARYNHYGINGLNIRDSKKIRSPEFKLSVINAIKKGKYSISQAALHFDIPSLGTINQWLQAFDKASKNGLFSKPKGRASMKPKYPKMPPKPKTEEERLRYRILELEAENAILKKLREFNQQKMQKKQGS